MSIMRRLGSRGARGATALVVGTAVGQGITLAITPLLSRMYTDEDFGFLSLVLSVVSIAAPAAALRLDSALMLPRDNRDASALLGTGIVSSVAVSLVTAGVLEAMFAFGWFATMAALPWFSLWAAGITFLTALFTLLSQFALRGHKYGSVGRRSIYQATLSAAAQLGFGLIGPSAAGLIGGYAIGRAAGIVPLALNLRGEIERFTVSDSRRLLKEYWRFPALFTPSAILNSAGLVIPVLFVGVWFTVADAGQWGMAERLLAAPLVLIATAAGQVVEAHVSQSLRDGNRDILRYYIKVSALLLGVAAVLVLAVVFLAPPLLPIILGGGWGTAAQLMIAMSPIIATRLIVSPMSKVLLVLQRGGWNLGLDIVRVILMLGVVAAAIVFEIDLITTAWLFSAALSIVYVVTWGVGLVATRQHAAEPV